VNAELLAVADALRNVRARLAQLLPTGLPQGSFADLTTVQLLGLEVAEALERLADAPVERKPTHLDERR
jgi:hypothetical protein